MRRLKVWRWDLGSTQEVEWGGWESSGCGLLLVFARISRGFGRAWGHLEAGERSEGERLDLDSCRDLSDVDMACFCAGSKDLWLAWCLLGCVVLQLWLSSQS